MRAGALPPQLCLPKTTLQGRRELGAAPALPPHRAMPQPSWVCCLDGMSFSWQLLLPALPGEILSWSEGIAAARPFTGGRDHPRPQWCSCDLLVGTFLAMCTRGLFSTSIVDLLVCKRLPVDLWGFFTSPALICRLFDLGGVRQSCSNAHLPNCTIIKEDFLLQHKHLWCSWIPKHPQVLTSLAATPDPMDLLVSPVWLCLEAGCTQLLLSIRWSLGADPRITKYPKLEGSCKDH